MKDVWLAKSQSTPKQESQSWTWKAFWLAKLQFTPKQESQSWTWKTFWLYWATLLFDDLTRKLLLVYNSIIDADS